MCTAITFQSKQGVNFFGRTMDFSLEKSRMVQNLNTQKLLVKQPDLWRPEGT
ncbi:linear amide C-N hydrolase [Caproicibacter sp.]|uniref:linear amide C-N hydrolase n=1 Tax=Caproicibacter sp. TaxID=2814884 RepID=UPI00398919A1